MLMKNFTFVILLIAFGFFANAQVTLTPVVDLGLQTSVVEVPQKFMDSFPTVKTLNLPAGYKARIFYMGGLNKPRALTFSPSGVLHVSDMNDSAQGKVIAFPDANSDGVADTMIVVASGFTNNHDVQFYKGNMYVTETTKMWKCTDANSDGIYESKTIFIDSIGGNTDSGHFTRTIVFDSLNQKMYLSIGSSCNVCRESNRAIIEQYNDDGTGKRTYASGVRNAVGMQLHPVTNRLWAVNNGSDKQGNEIPPEWVDIVRDGGFYGHPFAYANQVWFNFDTADYVDLKPIVAADSAMVATMIPHAGLIRAHSAPLEMEFFNPSFPTQFRKGFLVSLHGSWNTTMPNDFRGYKVVFGDLTDDNDTTVNSFSDFASGFLTDSINRIYWGRPVGLAVDNNGNIFMSSDETNKFIMQFYESTGTGYTEKPNRIIAGAAYPNPFNTSFTLPLVLRENEMVNISICDITGREVQQVMSGAMESGEHNIKVEWGNMTEGLYLLRIAAGDHVSIQKIHCIR
jgi:glucose/arabinose dehydrogenase